MSEADRPDQPRANASRRRRAHRPAGPGSADGNSAGKRTDRGSAKGGDSPRSGQGEKKKSGAQPASGSSTQQSAKGGQPGKGASSGSGADGQSRQGRRRRRGGRGRRGGRNQAVVADTQKQGGGEATHTVKSGDGTAGATSRQSNRSPRGAGRSKSGSGQPASTSTTRSGPPARSGTKSGGKTGGKPAGKNQAKNARGGRPGNRHQRGGQRMRTVLETSAGGLVVRGLAAAGAATPEPDLSQLEVALIGRLDRRGRMLWSMPKGHIEPGETIEETARREAHEETGADGTILGPLGIIDYWFVAEGRRIHKTVHHHLMRYDHGELCDEDPEITEVAWVAFDDLPRRLAYPDERRLVEKARTLLPDLARAELAGRNPAPAAAQQVDPSRRADGPEPVRRTGRGPSAGQTTGQHTNPGTSQGARSNQGGNHGAKPGANHGGNQGANQGAKPGDRRRGGQGNGQNPRSTSQNGNARRHGSRPSAPRDEAPEESTS